MMDMHRNDQPRSQIRFVEPRCCVAQPVDRPFHVGSWRVDPASREISDGSRIRKLSPRSMAALGLLAEADGDVVRREDFLDKIWPDVSVCEESVTTALSELRRALGETRGSAKIVETVQKAGYRLVAPVVFDDDPGLLQHDDVNFHLDAYTLLIEARRLRERGEKDRFERVDELCCEARHLARGFALADAQHAFAICFRKLYRGGGDIEAAAEIAKGARQRRPDLAFCHAAEGYVLYMLGDRNGARSAFGRAVTLDPGDFEAHFVACCGMYAMGDWRSAGALAERAALLQPDDYQTVGLAARCAEAMGDHRRAALNATRGLSRVETRLMADPDAPRARFAKALFASIAGLDRSVIITMTNDETCGTSVEFYRLLALARFGEVTAALDLLENLVDIGWRHADMLAVEPMFDSIRMENRFKRLHASLKH